MLIAALGLGLAVLPPNVGAGLAQTAVSEAPSGTASPIKEVAPHDLMTVSERFDLWRRMRAAATEEERDELRSQNYAELESRAAAKGVVLRDHDSEMILSGSHESGRTNWSGIGVHMRPPIAP